MHGTLRHGCDADMACVMLIDGLNGPIGLVERSAEAREEFLDCMAVLIAAQRLKKEPEVACCRRVAGPPPPEARLRPFGKSLQSAHVSGPICTWLAQAADDLMPNSNGRLKQNGKASDPSSSAAEIFAPKAASIVHEIHPTLSSQKRREVLLVDIDAAPTQDEGDRGQAPLVTPQWPPVGGTADRPNAGVPITPSGASGVVPGNRGSAKGDVAELRKSLPMHRETGSRTKAREATRRDSAPPSIGGVNGHADKTQQGQAGSTRRSTTPGTLGWDPGVVPQPVREPQPSADSQPMMMGNLSAEPAAAPEPQVA
jgi:hypothetical protein